MASPHLCSINSLFGIQGDQMVPTSQNAPASHFLAASAHCEMNAVSFYVMCAPQNMFLVLSPKFLAPELLKLRMLFC